MTEGEFSLGQWQITADSVQQYLRATEDKSLIYEEYEFAPPLCLTASVLGKLLEQLALPPGTIHSLQDVEIHRPVRWGQSIAGAARMGRPRQRGNVEFIAVNYTLQNDAGELVQSGQTTVLVTRSEAV